VPSQSAEARLWIFAVEDTSVELCWSSLPSRQTEIEVGTQSFHVDATPPPWYRRRLWRPVRGGAGGPGGVVVDGLEPDTTYQVRVGGRAAGSVRTMPAPPGRLLCKFATISDCHIGERRLGLLRLMHDPRPRPAGLDPYPVRSARAAVEEAQAWGAELIIAKGDLTREAEEDEAVAAAEVLRSSKVPVYALLGNHDVQGPADVGAILSSRAIHFSQDVHSVDRPGVRLIFGHSPVSGRRSGRLASNHARDLVELAGRADGPVVVALHHPPRRRPVPTYYPPSIGWRDSSRLMEGLAAANRSSLVLAGHTHRNRRYQVLGIDVAEVGSTKDFPGQWAGYAVYEGGIRQVVRRMVDPLVLPWTEMTRRALGGIWGWWSPGKLSDRCWTKEWPDPG
jgi:Icc protein